VCIRFFQQVAYCYFRQNSRLALLEACARRSDEYSLGYIAAQSTLVAFWRLLPARLAAGVIQTAGSRPTGQQEQHEKWQRQSFSTTEPWSYNE